MSNQSFTGPVRQSALDNLALQREMAYSRPEAQASQAPPAAPSSSEPAAPRAEAGAASGGTAEQHGTKHRKHKPGSDSAVASSTPAEQEARRQLAATPVNRRLELASAQATTFVLDRNPSSQSVSICLTDDGTCAR
jgi:hypothetical protein